MNIGISVVTYYPKKNGVQFITQNLAEELVKRGHNVTVITGNCCDCDKESVVNGVKVIRCDIRNKNMFHFGNKTEFHRLVWTISKQVDAMVFVCLESVAADWALEILDNINCQKVLYMHGMHRFKWNKIDFSTPKMFIYKVLRDIRWGLFYDLHKKQISNFDKIIHLHKEDDAYIFFEKRYPGKNYELNNFAEDLFFENEKKQVNKNYFVYVSNYHNNKNQLLLLKSIYFMNNDFGLVYVGSRENKYYRKLIFHKKRLDKKYSVNKNVEFLYEVSRDKIATILKSAYAFVMTSKGEVFPITIIEAMASNIPIISTDVGIVKYLPGVKIVKADVNSIAKVLDNLIENKEEYFELRNKSYSFAKQNLTKEKYIERFEKIIKKESN